VKVRGFLSLCQIITYWSELKVIIFFPKVLNLRQPESCKRQKKLCRTIGAALDLGGLTQFLIKVKQCR
jgi:hypothetical protein